MKPALRGRISSPEIPCSRRGGASFSRLFPTARAIFPSPRAPFSPSHALLIFACACLQSHLDRVRVWELDRAPWMPFRAPARPGKGGKGRGGSRLGMKTTLPPAAPAPPDFITARPPLPPLLSFPSACLDTRPSPFSAPPPASQVQPSPPFFLPESSSALPVPPSGIPPTLGTPSPAVPTSDVPPRPWQGAGLGAMPPNWVYPPGGYMNILQQPQYLPQPRMQGENFYLVGQTMSFNPKSPAPPQVVNQGNSTKETVNVDNEEGDDLEENRAVKKRYWTHEEEERLASAWLNASKDPIKGNDKKFDTFWNEVTEVFNKNGNGKRRREINQLKVHWSRLKSSITDFNDCWTKMTQLHTSGYSDDMLEEEAQTAYLKRFGKRFSLVHWWKKLKDEPKWCAQFEEKANSEKVDVPEEQSRPIGREAAKAERNGKRKKESVMEGIVVLGDNIEKIVKVQQDRKVEREKATEAQIQISNANLMAAKEQKEAKMFELYNSLLNQDTRNMSEDQKANRDRAIRKIEDKLFAD